MASLRFLRAINELKQLQAGKQNLPRAKWYKSWSHWRDALSQTREYKLFRARVFVRADGFCERCGDEGEHVHHIIGVYKDIDLCVDEKNGEMLCVKCHAGEHEHMRKKA